MIRRMALSLVSAAALLGACAPVGDLRGRGPITLSPDVEAVYQAYLERTRNKFQPGYFAVSPDGRAFGASYCPEHRCRGNYQGHALRLCNAKRDRQDCRLYARGAEIVWQRG